jgi:hypothetical protein
MPGACTSAASLLLPTQSFRDWQPTYAARGIPTFPVQIGPGLKKPMVANYCQFGLPASSEIARKFPNATAIGFMVGRRTGLTILDVDTPDERVLADALDRHGQTPVIVRSGSGNFQAWYRNNGEKRFIRPEPDIDILGSGFVVAPPSRGNKGDYQFIQGDLDDLDGLPIMQNVNIVSPTLSPALPPIEAVTEGHRNRLLWEHCMRSAHVCDDVDSLLDVARTANAEYLPPLPDAEVVKTAESAWGYTESGNNRFGQKGVWFPATEANRLIATDQDSFILLSFLRANNGPHSTFIAANGLAGKLGWTRKRCASARKRLEQSYITMVRRASAQNGPALYRWLPKRRESRSK